MARTKLTSLACAEDVPAEANDALQGESRHRWLKTALLSVALGVSAVAVAFGLPGSPAGAIVSGKAALSISGPEPLFESRLVPGESAEATVYVSNTGAVPLEVQLRPSIAATNSKSLASVLHVVVIDCGRLRSIQQCAIDPHRLFSGPLERMPPLPLGEYGCGEVHRFEITVRLPGRTGDRFQNASTRWDLKWSATTKPSSPSCS